MSQIPHGFAGPCPLTAGKTSSLRLVFSQHRELESGSFLRYRFAGEQLPNNGLVDRARALQVGGAEFYGDAL